MNFGQMVELVRVRFPDMGHPEAKHRINVAYREFARSSRCLVSDCDIPVVAATNTYPIDDYSFATVGYIDQILRIRILDASGVEISVVDEYMRLEERRIRFYSKSTGLLVTALPSTYAYIRVTAIIIPPEVAGLTDSPIMDLAFHDAIVIKALLDASLIYPGKIQPDERNELRFRYRELLINAKKYSGTQADGMGYEVHSPFETGVNSDIDYDFQVE